MASTAGNFQRNIRSQIHRLSTAKTGSVAPGSGAGAGAGTGAVLRSRTPWAAEQEVRRRQTLSLVEPDARNVRQGSVSTARASSTETEEDSNQGPIAILEVKGDPRSTKKTPISKDSPLLNKANNQCSPNPQVQRVRRFNRSLRRARTFRANQRARSCDPGQGRFENDENDDLACVNEVTFLVSQTKFGRRGWKVIPAEERFSLLTLTNCGVMDMLMTRIRDIEYSGQIVPEKITLVLK